MNILSLILALILVLAVVTIQKLEEFKNQKAIQIQQQAFLEKEERKIFNQRQKRLFGENQKTHRQLSFRYLLNKKLREQKAAEAKEARLIATELLKILYGHILFFKEMEQKRPHFLEELFTAIEEAADQAPEGSLKRIEDMGRLSLSDPELQHVLYRMLKGTLTREELKKLQNSSFTPRMQEKAYVSLFTFIHNKDEKISIQRSPRELLKAIFESDEVVDAVLTRRNELAKEKNSEKKAIFESEFKNKLRVGLSDRLLDFNVSHADRTIYD